MSLKTLLLSPVLLPQALWVSARATRLPEPEGPRRGKLGKGPSLRLLIVGDSSAAGVGATHQSEALAGPLERELAQHYSIEWQLSARSGATTASTLESLQSLSRQDCDAVFISLGVNDVKNAVSMSAWQRNYTDILNLLKAEFGAPRMFLSGLPPIRHFPLLPWPLNDVLGDRAALFDAMLREIATERSGVTFIPLEVPLDPAGMADDGFHPGPAIYADWAHGVAKVMIETLSAQ
ncbi:SGNH/GDSL hydrolase family protein [Roseovarius sp. 2305UL8-3]|uniref:SGNH/GDSL hydrolase family protein n=1 Tax=Roseovarius conchicola TaxID=3121636 RepID=UPI0035288E01